MDFMMAFMNKSRIQLTFFPLRLCAASCIVFLVLCLWDGPASALEVWHNQVGFDTQGLKRFRIVDTVDYGGDVPGFEVFDAADNMVMSGTAVYQGSAWGRHFWLGDISSLTAPGVYRIRAFAGASSAFSYFFTVEDDVLMRLSARAMVEFFYIQRCGYAVPDWHAACHLDDGQRPDGTHLDVSGGWHDSGEYQKYSGFFHPWATYALLEAYERRTDIFEALDEIEANGIPDILEEAMWGIRFEAAMVEPDGHVWVFVEKVRSGSSWVIPEEDTDNVVGTSDDRAVRDYPDPSVGPNSQALLVAANLAKLHRILAARGGEPAPDPSLLTKAEAVWNYYLDFGSGGVPFGDPRAQIAAAVELYLATENEAYRSAADTAADRVGRALQNNPGMEDSDIAGGGRIAASLAVYLEHFPDSPHAETVRNAVTAALDHVHDVLADNPVGLLRRNYYDEIVYFMGEPTPTDGWLRLGQNGAYGHTGYAAYLAASLTGDARYLVSAADQMDWIYGANPERWCMVHGLGSANPLGYHHRYAWIRGHLDGAVPGTVLNGYARDPEATDVDAPWIDTMENWEIDIGVWREVNVANYITNEPWLPNNAAVLLALAAQPFTPYEPPADADTDDVYEDVELDEGRVPEVIPESEEGGFPEPQPDATADNGLDAQEDTGTGGDEGGCGCSMIS